MIYRDLVVNPISTIFGIALLKNYNLKEVEKLAFYEEFIYIFDLKSK